MSTFILIALAAGLVWGWAMSDWRPLLRRGLPFVSILLGGVMLRQSVRALGSDAVQSGALDNNGLAGMMLILMGVMALLSLVIIYLGVQLGRAQTLSRRRKK